MCQVTVGFVSAHITGIMEDDHKGSFFAVPESFH